MLTHYLKRPETQRQYRSGIAGPYLDEFSTWLERRGYQRCCIRRQLRGAHRLSMWAEKTQVRLAELDEQALEAFQAHLETHDGLQSPGAYAVQLSRGARDLIAFLEATGHIPPAAPLEPITSDPELLVAFHNWMRAHRGTTEATLRYYRLTLLALLQVLGEHPKRFTPKALRTFLLDRAHRLGIGQAKNDVTAVRMFVRFLIAKGHCAPDLDQAIPTIARWRLASLPKYLPADEVERIIASCDLSTLVGVRDRAVLLLLSRLGLRAGDVAGLKLTDLHWDEATIEVAGKNRRGHRLPLPQDVGDAILCSLEQRPYVTCPQVFITTTAPLKALAPQSIGAMSARAIQRAGVKALSQGAHVLRHSAATEMLGQGLSLPAIGVVLRHTSIETTTGYAKVDFHLLHQVARPWPEEPSC
jgi:site-specific recombinase XerD